MQWIILVVYLIGVILTSLHADRHRIGIEYTKNPRDGELYEERTRWTWFCLLWFITMPIYVVIKLMKRG